MKYMLLFCLLISVGVRADDEPPCPKSVGGPNDGHECKEPPNNRSSSTGGPVGPISNRNTRKTDREGLFISWDFDHLVDSSMTVLTATSRGKGQVGVVDLAADSIEVFGRTFLLSKVGGDSVDVWVDYSAKSLLVGIWATDRYVYQRTFPYEQVEFHNANLVLLE